MSTNGNSKHDVPKWKRGAFVLALLMCLLILFEGVSVLFTEVSYPKKAEKEHNKQVQAAFLDASIADSIAMSLIKCERLLEGHHSKFHDLLRDEPGYCDYDHIKNAVDILSFAARKGNPSAQYHLALYYAGLDWRPSGDDNGGRWIGETMDGKDLDYSRAAYWYLKAAEQGDVRAMNNLALCYKRGEGVDKDLHQYLAWMKKAAEGGDGMALRNLGDIYRDGLKVEVGSHKEYRGYHYDLDYDGPHKIKEYDTVPDYETLVEPDIEKAKYYWQLSADKGNKEAFERLEKIY